MRHGDEIHDDLGAGVEVAENDVDVAVALHQALEQHDEVVAVGAVARVVDHLQDLSRLVEGADLLHVGVVQHRHRAHARDLLREVRLAEHARVQRLEELHGLVDLQLHLLVLVDHVADVVAVDHDLVRQRLVVDEELLVVPQRLRLVLRHLLLRSLQVVQLLLQRRLQLVARLVVPDHRVRAVVAQHHEEHQLEVAAVVALALRRLDARAQTRGGARRLHVAVLLHSRVLLRLQLLHLLLRQRGLREEALNADGNDAAQQRARRLVLAHPQSHQVARDVALVLRRGVDGVVEVLEQHALRQRRLLHQLRHLALRLLDDGLHDQRGAHRHAAAVAVEQRQQDGVALRQLRQEVLLHLGVRRVRVAGEDALQELHQRHHDDGARRLERVVVQQLHQQVSEHHVLQQRLLVRALQLLVALVVGRQSDHAQHLQDPEDYALLAALQRVHDQVHHALRLHEVVRQLRAQHQTVDRLQHRRRHLLGHLLVAQTGADLVVDRQVAVAQHLLLHREQRPRARHVGVELADGVEHLVGEGHRLAVDRRAHLPRVLQRLHARLLHALRVVLLRRVDLDARVRLHHLDHRLVEALHAADVQQRAQQRVAVAAAVAARRAVHELDQEHLRLVEAANEVGDLREGDHRRDHQRLRVQLQQVVLGQLHDALHGSRVVGCVLVDVKARDNEVVVDELALLLRVSTK